MTLVTAYPKKKRIKRVGKKMQELRREVFNREKGLCQMCKEYAPLNGELWYRGHLAHIKSKGAGGDDVAENCRWLCFICHIDIEHGPRWSKGESNGTPRNNNLP